MRHILDRARFDIYDISQIYQIDENKSLVVNQIFKDDEDSVIKVMYTIYEKRRSSSPRETWLVKGTQHITTYSIFDHEYRDLVLNNIN